MANENIIQEISYEAGSDLSTKQYYAVKISSGQLAVAGSGQAALGILQDKPDAQGRVGSVATGGVAKWKAAESITAGDKLSSDGSGLAQIAATGEYIVGTALEDGAANQIISVLIEKEGKYA